MIFAFTGCVLLGFLAGLTAFKVKSRWCSVHGIVKRCPLCAPVGSQPTASAR